MRTLRFSRRDLLKGGAAAVAGVTAASTLVGGSRVARAAGPIRVALPAILSGRVAILGTSSVAAAEMAVEAYNAKGGADGRMLELVPRDTKGKPDEAAKVARDLVNSEGCEVMIDCEASTGSFAIQEVIRELGLFCIHTNSETSELTANPKLFVPTAFRCARQGIHDAIGGGRYASGIVKAKGLKRWMSCSPDYAYGRGNTEEFFLYLKTFAPEVEVVDETWPKIFQPDYTENVNKILQTQPQALYSALWGGDLVSFVEQANLYSLFSGLTFFSSALGDPPVLTAIQNLPSGLNTVYRYNRLFPANPENAAFNEAYVKKTGQQPTNWSWQTYLAFHFLFAALDANKGSTDALPLAKAIEDLKLPSAFGIDGTVTMRGSDHTIIGYPVAWGETVPHDPYVEHWDAADWSEIVTLEAEWKKSKGWA